jgi:hypothetical protein
VGAALGFIGAAALALIGIIRWALVSLTRPVDASLQDLVGLGVYVLGGAAAGIIAGMLFPLARNKIGASVVGMVSIQPFLYGIFLITSDEPQSGGTNLFVWLLMTIIFGPVIGLAWIRPWCHDPTSEV